MPRTKPRTSNKGTYTGEQMKAALQDVLAGKTIRSAAKDHDLNYNTLNRKYKKLNGSEIPDESLLTANYTHNQVFSPDLEVELTSYIRERSELGHGLDTDEVRTLAFDFAEANAIQVPENWKVKKTAGKEWFMAFMKRNRTLPLRLPQAFSASRAACFNKPNIQNYFEKLNTVLDRNPRFASGERIFNADEIGTTTVGAITRKVVGPKGSRQVHQAQSHERGESVTSMFFAYANGTFLPPVMLFPRITYNTGMGKDCYPGTKGIATGKKGYMNHIVMVQSIQHFIDHSNSSKENPSLLIVDNFGSHITLSVINLCKENGVTLFTLPPHTTHRTQPLDVGVFKPFKNAYNKAVHTWNSQNAGRSVSIYEVAGFVHTAILQSFTPQNILSAFRATGIHPFNPDIFPEKDFFKSSVTYQENPPEAGPAQLANNEKDDNAIPLND
ncbi:hypothetical protein FOCC_FOCC017585, partial [Frankliniella occidentalis]|uniref:Uncharacterized protein LOC127751989 n=1 Tax=Frankliniella occidentalis TaxID=133901 RepID=A0A9C6XAQ1_FRAOC